MSLERKSLSSALVISGLLVAGIAGMKFRSIRDLPNTQETNLSSMLASNGKELEIAETDYFTGIIELLRGRYVDQVPTDDKLLSGAVRGMIVGLRDVDSQFYKPEEFTAFKSIRAGRYPGIGVWMDYKPQKVSLKLGGVSQEQDMPRLTVVSVAPGSPADKAGVKPGDLLDSVDDHWVMNSEAIIKYQAAQADFMAKKIDFKTINDMRKSLKARMDKSIMPVRAREKLITGNTGELAIIWERAGKKIETKIAKAETDVQRAVAADGTVNLMFTSGAVEDLTAALKDKSAITLDLRNNVLGDMETMRRCLALVAPAGTYGYFKNERKSSAPVQLTISKGNSTPPKIKLIVDQSTRDAAEIFALALQSKGIATLSGTDMGNSRKLKDVVQLPDGSGYTLNIGTFTPGKPPTTKVAQAKEEAQV
ncbi:MAG: S41 family peptidase [Armatimonadota bacterium]